MPHPCDQGIPDISHKCRFHKISAMRELTILCIISDDSHSLLVPNVYTTACVNVIAFIYTSTDPYSDPIRRGEAVGIQGLHFM